MGSQGKTRNSLFTEASYWRLIPFAVLICSMEIGLSGLNMIGAAFVWDHLWGILLIAQALAIGTLSAIVLFSGYDESTVHDDKRATSDEQQARLTETTRDGGEGGLIVIARHNVVLLIALASIILALSVAFARDSILLLVGLFLFLAVEPYLKKWFKQEKVRFKIELISAVCLMIGVFFWLRVLLPEAADQAKAAAIALLILGFKLIVFPIYNTESRT